jgi:hypothetical protein
VSHLNHRFQPTAYFFIFKICREVFKNLSIFGLFFPETGERRLNGTRVAQGAGRFPAHGAMGEAGEREMTTSANRQRRITTRAGVAKTINTTTSPPEVRYPGDSTHHTPAFAGKGTGYT